MLRFDKDAYLSIIFKFVYTFIIPLLNSVYCYCFLAISFVRYKEYMICLILFSKFSDVLLAFTCARAIGNL